MSVFRRVSLRGLLDIMPSRDFHFYGVTWRWIAVGLIVTRHREKA